MPLISAEEQLAIELINNARLNPLTESSRQNVGLNDGLAAGTITADVKQPLAVNSNLNISADRHSDWMLEEGIFSHTGDGGSTATQRMRDAGYDLQGSWSTGENLALATTDPSGDQSEVTNGHHDRLFESEGHRSNMMNDRFSEIGLAQNVGEFTQAPGYGLFVASDITDTVSMQTANYGQIGSSRFLTGVAYDDLNGDGLYSIGEAVSGVRVEIGDATIDTATAGGYSLQIFDGAETTEFTAVRNGSSMSASVLSEGRNVKVDLVDGDTLASSASMKLEEGGINGKLLGEADLALGGNDLNNVLTGNIADNAVAAGEGSDIVFGRAGDDRLDGGAGNDVLLAGSGNDVVAGGSGTNVLIGGPGENLMEGGDEGNIFISSGTFTTMIAGAGEDFFHLSGNGAARIEGFDPERDILDFGNRQGTLQDIMAAASVRNADNGATGDLVFSHAGGIETVLVGGAAMLETIPMNILDGQDDDTRTTILETWFGELTPEQAAIVVESTLDASGSSALLGSDQDAISENFPTDVAAAVNTTLQDGGQEIPDDGPDIPASPEDPDTGNDPEDEEESDSGSDGSCFVATASFGDALHPDVTWLRRWRDEVLVTHPVGRGFIRFYWKAGPVLARHVEKHPAAGMIGRSAISRLVSLMRRREP